MKVLLYETDAEYSRRIQFYLPKKYASIQISVVSELEELKNLLMTEQIDVVLVAEDYESFQPSKNEDYLKNSAFAYLSATNEIVDGVETIYKYQSVSDLYDKICSLYEKKKNRVIRHEQSDEKQETQLVTFLPVHGGAGNSTMAAACAISLSRKGYSVLYMNFEQRPCDDVFFAGNSQKGLTEVVSTLRSQYTETSLVQVLKDVIQKDQKQKDTSVSFIRGFANIMDSLALKKKNLEVLLRVIRTKFEFDYVILDTDYIAGDNLQQMILMSDKLVFVSSGSDIANSKLEGVKRYLEIISRDADDEMPENFLILNQYYPVADEHVVTLGMKVIARLARYRTDDHQRISSQSIIDEVCSRDGMFDALASFEVEAQDA